MTWHHVLTANHSRGAIFNARTIHTLPVNHHGSAIPKAREHLTGVQITRAVPSRTRTARPECKSQWQRCTNAHTHDTLSENSNGSAIPNTQGQHALGADPNSSTP